MTVRRSALPCILLEWNDLLPAASTSGIPVKVATRYASRLSARLMSPRKSQNGPAAVGRPPGSWEETPNVGLGRRRDTQGSPSAGPLRKAEDAAARRRISTRRKPTHPDAEGIADDGEDENGEYQRPTAVVVIEVHRSGSPAAPVRKKQGKPKSCALFLVLDVT